MSVIVKGGGRGANLIITLDEPIEYEVHHELYFRTICRRHHWNNSNVPATD